MEGTETAETEADVSEMIERVAKALHDMHGAGPAYETAADDWRDMARAAISTMRDMIDEALSNRTSGSGRSGGGCD